ncbi:LacI family DNA-binding transcriptional regulator [Cohnella kolymensis]|uniref:LacI family DNA-binding transcriptional regulator n=1 Tax=Cohnella kolymensis TaxID=1590652 RepID=UPI000695C5CA|nr:LacI family DNA-binding transcriptional regulator [Cohnella kolymensis]
MTPTIKDVAAAAGVSIGTVSKVINKSGFVSERIRERVLLAISLLNYKPNAIARSLKQSKTKLIGILVDDISNLYTMKIIKAVENFAYEMEYNLISCSHNNQAEQEKKALQWLLEKRVDGIIIMPIGSDLDDLNVPNIMPLVFVETKDKNERFDSVIHENMHTSAGLVEHLYSHGHRKFLFIHGSLRHSAEKEKLVGIRQAISNLKLDIDEQNFLDAGTTLDSIAASVRNYLKHEGLPQGIYATNHLALAGTIRALWDMDIRVPDDIAIVGFGDIDTYGILKPSVTVAKQDPYEVGKIAYETLFERIEMDKPISEPKEFVISPKIILGASCGCHPIVNHRVPEVLSHLINETFHSE